MQNCMMPRSRPSPYRVGWRTCQCRQGSTAARHAPITGAPDSSFHCFTDRLLLRRLFLYFYYLRLAAASRFSKRDAARRFLASSAAPYLSTVRRLVRGSGQRRTREPPVYVTVTVAFLTPVDCVVSGVNGPRQCTALPASASPYRRMSGRPAAVRHRRRMVNSLALAHRAHLPRCRSIRAAGVGQRKDLARARGSGASTRCRGRPWSRQRAEAATRSRSRSVHRRTLTLTLP